MAQIISLAQNCDDAFDLIDVMQYQVTEECPPIFNVNGTIRKVVKSKLVDKFSMNEQTALDAYIAVVDMGFIWRLSNQQVRTERSKMVKISHGVIMRKKYSTSCLLVTKRLPKSFS